jgi:predicted RND superfamily exporter protein
MRNPRLAMVRLAYVTTLLQFFTLCASVESCSSLSGGAVAGIVILVLIVVALLVVVAILLLRDRRYQIRAEVQTLRVCFVSYFQISNASQPLPGRQASRQTAARAVPWSLSACTPTLRLGRQPRLELFEGF